MRNDGLGKYFWLSFALAIAWSLYRLLTNQAWILDDEIAHFLISADVWNNPKELWHSWSRPGRNLLHFIPAHFGLTSARLWTLFLAGVAMWLTGREGKRLGLANLWVLPLLVGFQWWFPELSYPVLTQTPFMITWIAGVFFAMRKHLVPAAICFGYLGLVRHEGIALSGLFGLWVIFAPGGFARFLARGDWKKSLSAFPHAVWIGAWTILPMVLINIATQLTRGEVPFLMFFESKPTEMYGSGPLWLYCQHLATGAGFPIVILFLIGAFRKWGSVKWDLLLYATYPAYFALQSIIYWKGLFASGGYYHFIMPMAPFVGLVALRGFNLVKPKLPTWGVALVVGAVVYTGLLMPQQQFIVGDTHIAGMPHEGKSLKIIAPPMTQSRYGQGLKDAAAWTKENIPADQPWISHHTALTYWNHGKIIGQKLGAWDNLTPKNLPSGTLLIWDAQYSTQESFGFTLEALEANGWQEEKNWAHGTVRVFRKK
jgi:hypothetical protein